MIQFIDNSPWDLYEDLTIYYTFFSLLMLADPELSGSFCFSSQFILVLASNLDYLLIFKRNKYSHLSFPFAQCESSVLSTNLLEHTRCLLLDLLVMLFLMDFVNKGLCLFSNDL